MVEAINLKELATLVATHPDVDPVTLQFVPIATGKHNSSFWVVADGVQELDIYIY
jgi:hypothetical protein